MAKKNRNDLYEEFKNGDIPNQEDFADTIDSALNLVDDGLISYKVMTPEGELKRIGIGDTAPSGPLGIKGETGQDDQMISFTSADESQKWNINLNPTGQDVDGFSVDDATTGISNSRLFIKQSTGNVGVNTVAPSQKLHVAGANDGGNVSMMVENLEAGSGRGWLMSHMDDNVVTERVNTFAIQEKKGNDLIERITVLSTQGMSLNPIQNVGVNEVLPYATLHVTKPVSDPSEPLNLAENTGILCLGQIDDNNLVMDSRQIQARAGEYIGSTLSFTTSELALQPLGGGLTVNAQSSVPGSMVYVDNTGRVGVGKEATEKMEIAGAVVVGDTDTASPANGTIRWSELAEDLQVWQNLKWHSLTQHENTDGIWTDGGDGVIYYNPEQPAKVGIGTEQPTAMLHVKETNGEAATSTGAVAVINQAETSDPDAGLTRIGLGINCSGPWSPNPAALNVGLYVTTVTGQTLSSSNIGALINGNTVVGNITGNPLIGENGTNVLAIQNGTAPTSAAGITETAGIQIYSSTVTGSTGNPTSAFNVMTGDGAIIQLYRQHDMTPSDVNMPSTGNGVTDALISNMRTRINELEAILKALGLLNP
jgi:hypothetical protein